VKKKHQKNNIETTLFLIDFFSLLEAVLNREKISKTELSKRLKTSPKRIKEFFENTTDCNISMLIAVCQAIGVQMSPEFITNTNEITIRIETRKTYPHNSYCVMKL
jgi:plasmid maintenance system antidote protein VapI